MVRLMGRVLTAREAPGRATAVVVEVTRVSDPELERVFNIRLQRQALERDRDWLIGLSA